MHRILQLIHPMPNCFLCIFSGLCLVEGGLRAKNLKIQQNRVWESIGRINPVLSAVRMPSGILTVTVNLLNRIE